MKRSLLSSGFILEMTPTDFLVYEIVLGGEIINSPLLGPVDPVDPAFTDTRFFPGTVLLPLIMCDYQTTINI